MAEPYTPTTESIRRDYAEHRKDCMHSPSYEQSRRFREDGSGEGEFDRWFEAEIAKAARTGAEEALRIVKDEWYPDEWYPDE